MTTATSTVRESDRPPQAARLADRVNDLIGWLLSIVLVVPAFWLLMKVFNRTTVRGKHHLQTAPLPLMFVFNHVSILDNAFVDVLVFPPRALRDRKFLPYHVPEERNFFKGPVMSWFMRRVRCIPIRRGEGVYQPAVERAIEILRHGGCVHVAPEGTRTRSGKLLPGKAGVGRVLYETGATVVPCFHRGMGDILPIGARFPRFGRRAEIIVGPPFRVDQFLSLPNTRETWQRIADHVMERIAALE
jgi:1-acyl-sn-glycerol-3-phosphate acyltransferase